jgi:hypothetical protein
VFEGTGVQAGIGVISNVRIRLALEHVGPRAHMGACGPVDTSSTTALEYFDAF